MYTLITNEFFKIGQPKNYFLDIILFDISISK
jgi:hypothetical protein